jgi:transposase
MWTDQNRDRYNRDALRNPSDLTDEEWDVLRPLIPRAKHGGRPRKDVARRTAEGPARQPASSIVKARRAPKKRGGLR